VPRLRHPDRLGLHLRIVLSDGVAIGPGRADLLDAIHAHGSISAAGRTMAMSYKRAWDLVETMNAAFARPLVDTSAGGASGGGSRLTATGLAVLSSYRRIETLSAGAASGELALLAGLLAPTPSPARP
jgi:molybdate transport system regulatory protein